MAATVTGEKLRNKRGFVGVGFDIRGVKEFGTKMDQLLRDRAKWVQEDAMKTVYRAIPVYARRDIQQEYNIRAERVREHMAVRYLDGGNGRRGGVQLIGQWKRGIGMMQYPGTKQLKRGKGVSYSVYRGARSREPDAFIARMLAGDQVAANLHVVQRYGPKVIMLKGRYKGKKRQRVEVLYRATVAQMLARGRRPERIADHATMLLEKETRRLLKRYLN